VNYVDVTPVVSVLRAEGASVCCSNSEYRGINAGVNAVLGMYRAPRSDLQVLTGLRVSIASMNGYALNVWDVPVEGGWRWSGREGALVRGYGEVGVGPHLYVVVPQYQAILGDVGFGTHTGFGATIGTGDVRGVLGLRASVSVGFDQLSGHVSTVEGDRYWDWHPLSARVDGYAGVEFR
jgi:hypothetical protein